MKRILLIAPLVDIPTITANKAVKEILEYAKKRNDTKIDLLWGLAANKISFFFHTLLKKFDAIFYWGHGEINELKGTHHFGSMINKRNIHRAKGIAFDTMACSSAKELGRLAIQNGIPVYIGTNHKYFGAFPEKERNFLKDWIDYTTIRQKAIIDGKTFGEAYTLFKQKATHYLKIYKTNIGYKNYDWYYKTLQHNLNHTILLGNSNVYLH